MKTTHKILGIFPEYQIKTYPLEVRVKTNIEGLKVQSKDVEKDKEAVVATTKFVPTSYQVTGKTDLGSLDIKVTTDVKQAKDNKVVLSLLTNTYEIQASLPKDISNPTNIKLFANDKEITTNLTKDIKLVDNQEVTIYATFVYENATYKTKKISLTADPETHIIEAKLALDEEAQSKIKKTQKEREHKEAQEQKERETRENIESFMTDYIDAMRSSISRRSVQFDRYFDTSSAIYKIYVNYIEDGGVAKANIAYQQTIDYTVTNISKEGDDYVVSVHNQFREHYLNGKSDTVEKNQVFKLRPNGDSFLIYDVSEA